MPELCGHRSVLVQNLDAGKGKPDRRDHMKTDACGVFGVESGIPVILMGVLFFAVALLPLIIPGFAALPIPISVLFAGFGVFLVWVGLTK